MTYQEITKKYTELFIMLVESAGHSTGNSSYSRVSEILKEPDNEKVINSAIEDEVEFKIFVTILIFEILDDIYGTETLKTWDSDQAADKITEFYTEFLKKATRKFCSKYGLEIFDDPETAFSVITRNIKENHD